MDLEKEKMSEFPKKEQNAENEAPITDNNTAPEASVEDSGVAEIKKMASDENTTIFVKHVYNTKKPAKNNNIKRLIVCITAIVLCVAIGGSILLVNKFLPDDKNSSSNTSGLDALHFELLNPSNIIKPSFVEIDGKSVEVESNIKSVSIFNSNEIYSFASYYKPAEKKEETSSEATTSSASATTSTSSQTEKTYLYDTFWRLNGIREELTDSNSIERTIKSFLTIRATQEMENTFDTVAEYHSYFGFDEPSREVTFEFNDGTEDLIITVGGQMPTGDANYLKLSTSDKVYVVASGIISVYDSLPVDFGNKKVVDALSRTDSNKSYFNESAELARYDYIKISGGIFNNTVYDFKMATGVSADYMRYMMKAPYNRPASNEFISSILYIIGNGLNADSLYAYSATNESLEICGFTEPRCVIDAKVGDKKIKLTIGGSLTEDGSSLAIMVDGKPQIFKVASSTFDFLNAAALDQTKMLNDNFIMENITTIKTLVFTDSTGRHAFNLKHTKRTDSENAYDTVVTYNGKDMNVKHFKSIYQRVLMMSLLEYTLEAEKTDDILKIEFIYDDGGNKTVNLTKATDDMYHYLAWVDGTVMGEVLKSTIDDIISSLAVYISGGEVPEV